MDLINFITPLIIGVAMGIGYQYFQQTKNTRYNSTLEDIVEKITAMLGEYAVKIGIGTAVYLFIKKINCHICRCSDRNSPVKPIGL